MPLTNFKADLTFYLKKLAGVHAVGELWWHYDPKSKPAGVQLFSGQLLSREAYTDHWTLVSIKRTVVTEEEWQEMVANHGFCQFYSSGDGSTTYRMPLVKGVHPKFMAALAEAGQYLAAGLPNIVGTLGNATSGFGLNWTGGITTSGAFSIDAAAECMLGGGSSSYGMTATRVKLQAAASSPIYGNSDTVQPPALTFLLGEYVVGSVATLGEADAESLLASVTMLESRQGELESSVANAVPAGFVMPFASNSDPEGYLLCNGAAVSRTTYSVLFSAIGTTYGAGDGSTTFNLPNLTDRFIQGSGTAGTVKAAGAPNITGRFGRLPRNLGAQIEYPQSEGALYWETSNITETHNSNSTINNSASGFIVLNASLSSPVYRANCDTIQPPALTMRYYIKY